MNADKDIQAAIAQQTLAGALAFEIQERRRQALVKGSAPYPRTVSILSDIGECDRQMVYSVTNWQDKPPFDEDTLARFEAGKDGEKIMIRNLIDLGYEVVSGQEVIEIKNRTGETVGRGKIDGKIVYHGIKIPVEIKTMHPMTFENIDAIEDFEKKPYLRKYLRQLTMYLYGNNIEEGLLMCTDLLGHWKLFVVRLDFGFAEQIIQRLERVHAALKAGQQPDRIDYRDEICGKCVFAHICLPDVLRKESEIIVDEDLIQRLERRDALSEARSEYERIDRTIKADIKKRVTKRAIAGDFVIQISDPIAVAEKTVKAYTMQKVSIDRMGDIEHPKSEAA